MKRTNTGWVLAAVICGACSSKHRQSHQTRGDHAVDAAVDVTVDAAVDVTVDATVDAGGSSVLDAAAETTDVGSTPGTETDVVVATNEASDSGSHANTRDEACALPPAACELCDPGWFCPSSDEDAIADRQCTAFKTCGPGTFVATPGDAEHDRTCKPCTQGTYSTMPNQPECLTWAECADTDAVNPGSSTEDRVCFAITRVSVTESGGEADGSAASLSGDGAILAFTSTSASLVANDDNEVQDVFVKDLRNGAVVRANLNAVGEQSDVLAREPRISRDGRFVVFTSVADDLVDGDTNTLDDVFLKDMHSGALEVMSSTASGARGTGASFSPSISYDGQRVAFLSESSNLVTEDGFDNVDVFVKDMHTSEVTRVSTTSQGREVDGSCYHPRISGDGNHVVFSSNASDLVADDLNGTEDVFMKDLTTGSTTRVSVDAAGVEGDGRSNDPAVSRDGRYVAFHSSSHLAGENSLAFEIFLKDLTTGAVTRLSADTEAEGGYSFYPSISGDGRFVAFYSRPATAAATNVTLLGGVHFVDTLAQTTRRLTVTAAGELATDYAYCDDLSADGRFVAISTAAANLVPDDENDASDVFVVRAH